MLTVDNNISAHAPLDFPGKVKMAAGPTGHIL